MLTIVEALKKNPVFQSFPPDMLKPFAETGKPKSFPPGAALCREGEDGNEIFLILEGEAEITCAGLEPPQRGVSVLTVGPGDLVGEISFIEEGPRAATVTAKSLVHAAGWPSSGWRMMCEHHPAVGYRLMAGIAALLCQRLKRATRKMTSMKVILGGGNEGSHGTG